MFFVFPRDGLSDDKEIDKIYASYSTEINQLFLKVLRNIHI